MVKKPKKQARKTKKYTSRISLTLMLSLFVFGVLLAALARASLILFCLTWAGLLTDAAGRRLSKRDGDGCMESVRARYLDARPVIGALAASLGLIPSPESMTVEQLLPLFDWKKIPRDAVLLPEGF